jgi:hypothetical protein
MRDLNRDAITLRRRGYVGIRSDEYAGIHAVLNMLLFQHQLAPKVEQ